MKVYDLIEDDLFILKTNNETANKEIKGVYCCDLLSFVMSKGSKNDLWITVQTHMNIVAIASLLEFACILVPENINIEEETLIKANEEDICILSTSLNAYEIFKKLYEAGIK